MQEVWQLMSIQLYFIRHAFDLEVLSFVLMANHFHLLVRAPQANLSTAMAFFMRETSRELARSSQRINMTYGGRFFRTSLTSHHHFLNAYKYVYRNPVQAGVVTRVEEYPWSTLPALIGLEHTTIPVTEDLTLFSDVEGTLRWLNQDVCNEDWESVRNALRRKQFQLRKTPISRRPNRLERHLL